MTSKSKRKRSVFGLPFHSPGGREYRKTEGSSPIRLQNFTKTPGGITDVWHDVEPPDGTCNQEWKRHCSSSNQAARKSLNRMAESKVERDARLVIRREVHASIPDAERIIKLAERREVDAAIPEADRIMKLADRREVYAAIPEADRIMKLADRREVYAAIPEAEHMIKLTERREKYVKPQSLCSKSNTLSLQYAALASEISAVDPDSTYLRLRLSGKSEHHRLVAEGKESERASFQNAFNLSSLLFHVQRSECQILNRMQSLQTPFSISQSVLDALSRCYNYSAANLELWRIHAHLPPCNFRDNLVIESIPELLFGTIALDFLHAAASGCKCMGQIGRCGHDDAPAPLQLSASLRWPFGSHKPFGRSAKFS